MTELKIGDILEGVVSGIQKYGVFVTLDNGYNGLIHVSEISNKFVKNINDYVNLGEKINVKIIEIDEETKQCKLSIKDINYIRIKNDNVSIKEVGQGFEKLRNNLDNWIEVKKQEIDEKNTKKN